MKNYQRPMISIINVLPNGSIAGPTLNDYLTGNDRDLSNIQSAWGGNS